MKEASGHPGISSAASGAALPKWRADYEALPEWAQKLVRGLANCGGYGSMRLEPPLGGRGHEGFQVELAKEARQDWWDGFFELRELAAAMTAPWPPPPPPAREKRAFNVVELMTDGEDGGGFNQPCAFGCLSPGHAVYCHNDAWPDGPRKCRRTWYTGGETRDEDCPGFVANPDAGTSDAHDEVPGRTP